MSLRQDREEESSGVNVATFPYPRETLGEHINRLHWWLSKCGGIQIYFYDNKSIDSLNMLSSCLHHMHVSQKRQLGYFPTMWSNTSGCLKT